MFHTRGYPTPADQADAVQVLVEGRHDFQFNRDDQHDWGLDERGNEAGRCCSMVSGATQLDVPGSRGFRRPSARPAGSGDAKFGEPGTVVIGGAEGELVALGPLEVQVGRVLPGHADAAVQLDALLGGVHGDIAAVRLRDGGRDRGVRVAAA